MRKALVLNKITNVQVYVNKHTHRIQMDILKLEEVHLKYYIELFTGKAVVSTLSFSSDDPGL